MPFLRTEYEPPEFIDIYHSSFRGYKEHFIVEFKFSFGIISLDGKELKTPKVPLRVHVGEGSTEQRLEWIKEALLTRLEGN